jgi:hypothetical protein
MCSCSERTLYEQGVEQERQCVKDMATSPYEAAFTLDCFDALVEIEAVGAVG